MVFLLAYLALLLAWIFFVPALIRSRGAARWWAALAVASGLGAMFYEGWMTFVWAPTVTAPIRVDIFLIVPLLACIYIVVSLVLRSTNGSRAAVWGGLWVGAALLLTAVGCVHTGFQLHRMAETFEEGNELLFAARFRNEASYRQVFAMGLSPVPGAEYPVGHWESEGETGHYTRMIINPHGRLFLYFECGSTECQHGSGAALQAVSGARGGWCAKLDPSGGVQKEVCLASRDDGSLSVQIAGSSHHFRRTEPPIPSRSAEPSLEYLGTFSALEPSGDAHARLTQVWLWRSQEGLLAVAIFSTVLDGQRARFLRPIVLGAGGWQDGRWHFEWQRRDELWEIEMRLRQGGVDIEFPVGPTRWTRDSWTAQILTPGAIVEDQIIELAPLSSREDWQHWFEVQMVGHFSSAAIPKV